MTIPFLVLVIAIVAVLGPGLFNLYVAVSVVGWVPYARLMRAEMMVQSQRDYAAAARVMGFGASRIIFGHLLPNAITPTIVYWMTDMSLADPAWARASAISVSAPSRRRPNGAC